MKKNFFRKFLIVPFVSMLTTFLIVTPVSAGVIKAEKETNIHKCGHEELIQFAANEIYSGISCLDDSPDYDSYVMTDIYPFYTSNLTEGGFDAYLCFLVKDGKTVAQLTFTSLTHIGFEYLLDYSLIDRVLLSGEPCAVFSDEYASYLITKDRTEVYMKGLYDVSDRELIEGKDFSIYHDKLTSLRFVRMGQYHACRKEYRKGEREVQLYRPGWNEIEGDRYYIKSDGTVLTQSMTIGGIRWKFGENGVCQGKYTGFTKSGKGRRYWKNGILQKNRTVTLKNGTVYTADEKGYLTAG